MKVKLYVEQIAILAKNIATSIVDPSCLEAFVACRLIPLNKNPGVRPIGGVDEVLRRIIGKAIEWVLNQDIQEAAGPLQASTGIKGGAEAAIHVMRDIFSEESTDVVILVDASSGFSTLNRQVALHNIQYICLPFATVLINTYRMSSRLFVTGGREIASQEGTTQGDNLAMVFYGLATKPLLEKLKTRVNKIKQVWLADDATGAGDLHSLKEWWDQFGYCPLVWMHHSRTLNARINKIQERALRLVYKDNSSTFSELLHKDLSVTIHEKNLKVLLTEMYRVENNLSPKIMNTIFCSRNICYPLTCARKFGTNLVKTILCMEQKP